MDVCTVAVVMAVDFAISHQVGMAMARLRGYLKLFVLLFIHWVDCSRNPGECCHGISACPIAEKYFPSP